MTESARSTVTVLRECEYVSIRLGPRSALEIVWHQFTPSRHFRPIFVELADSFRTHGRPRRWLCDHSASKIIAPEDQLWLLNAWVQSLRDSGAVLAARRVAVVQAKDLFARRSVVNVTSRIARDCGRLDLQLFERRADAAEWLGLSDDPRDERSPT